MLETDKGPVAAGIDGRADTQTGGASEDELFGAASSGPGRFTPTATPPRLPTPTPIPDTAVALSVARGGKTFTPTVTELKALPTIEINAGGPKKGISMATIGEKVGANDDSIATIQGTRVDNLRLGAVRFPVADIGGSTVFVVDDSGHVALFSSSIPQEQWLKDVTSIALN